MNHHGPSADQIAMTKSMNFPRFGGDADDGGGSSLITVDQLDYEERDHLLNQIARTGGAIVLSL